MTKVVVINFSGNVGKSTIAAHMLGPRMGEPRIYSVETLNVDASDEGVDVERVRGNRFADLVDEVMLQDRAIVDVGASNAEAFMKGMTLLEGSHEEFDYFVVPTVATTKQIQDTNNTVTALRELGVPADRIRILFNRVEDPEDITLDFGALLLKSEVEGACIASPAAAVHSNDVFGLLKGSGTSLAQICADEIDWRDRMRTAADPAERVHATNMLKLKRLSGSASKNLDQAFQALFA